MNKFPPGQLFIDLLPTKARQAFLYCSKLPLFSGKKWYLAGGTALALQVGHRQSIDLDFFTTRPDFRVDSLERQLLKTGNWVTSFRDKGTLYGTLLQAKLSFIAYPFFVPAKPLLRYGKLQILLPEDIAAMKIIAISQRGRKRDFIDLYWYCLNREPLDQIIKKAIKQYPYQEHSIVHFLTSLTYFVDAEPDPMPKIFFKASWKEIKKYFQTQVPQITKKLLGLK